jgi:V-type H+-transporting ATPase subunit B
MAKPINAREAFELHKSAVTRDFIAKPRLGNIL